jgi:hypothetical protein
MMACCLSLTRCYNNLVAPTCAVTAEQLIGLLQRWLPGREVVVVADSSYAVIELLKQVSDTPNVSLITRLRLDAACTILRRPIAPGKMGDRARKGRAGRCCNRG